MDEIATALLVGLLLGGFFFGLIFIHTVYGELICLKHYYNQWYPNPNVCLDTYVPFTELKEDNKK